MTLTLSTFLALAVIGLALPAVAMLSCVATLPAVLSEFSTGP